MSITWSSLAAAKSFPLWENESVLTGHSNLEIVLTGIYSYASQIDTIASAPPTANHLPHGLKKHFIVVHFIVMLSDANIIAIKITWIGRLCSLLCELLIRQSFGSFKNIPRYQDLGDGIYGGIIVRVNSDKLQNFHFQAQGGYSDYVT